MKFIMKMRRPAKSAAYATRLKPSTRNSFNRLSVDGGHVLSHYTAVTVAVNAKLKDFSTFGLRSPSIKQASFNEAPFWPCETRDATEGMDHSLLEDVGEISTQLHRRPIMLSTIRI